MKIFYLLILMFLFSCATPPKIITRKVYIKEPSNSMTQAKEVERCMINLVDKNVKTINSYEVCDKIHRIHRIYRD